MARMIQSRRVIRALSCAVAVAAGISILAFGAPPIVLILASWGSVMVFAPLYAWSSRRVGRW